MSSSSLRSSANSCAPAFLRLFAASLAILVILSFTSTAALAAPCGTLAGTVVTWNLGANGFWNTAGNWSPGNTPDSTHSACIVDGTSTVTLNANSNLYTDDLEIGSGNTLTSGINMTLYMYGTQLINNGSFILNGGSGANDILSLQNSVTLSGAGTLTLNVGGGGGNAYIQQGSGGVTLTNQSTIQGAGIIGNSGLTLANSGTINANSSGQALYFNNSGGTTNTGLMEASNSGILQFAGFTILNGGGNITANSGGTVQLFNSVHIVGGTLNNNGGTIGTSLSGVAYLDGSTGAGAINLNGTYTAGINTDTYLLGTINNNNNIQLNGGSGSNAILFLDSSNVILQGGGTVTMFAGSGGGTSYIQQAVGNTTLTNVNNTIQGTGIIGNSGMALVNQTGGIINANVGGQALYLNPSGGITNTGLMEASGGGILQFNSTTVNNAGGHITANSGSTVQIYGNTHIVGGTLTNNGSFLGAPVGAVAYLDGLSNGALTINGTYTSDTNTNTYLLGAIKNQGTIQLNGGGGSNIQLLGDSTSVMLTGGGIINMTVAGGGGNAFIDQAVGGVTLTNVNNTIQGAGNIGNGGLTLVNQATINANSSGQTLLLNGSGGVTNTGLMEASNGGVLQMNSVTVNNGGGHITANSGSNVQIFGNSVIQGGTLTNNGSFFGTPVGQVAYLDSTTSAGVVTINGTYTTDYNSNTYLRGTFTNTGTILVNGGSGSNTQLLPDSGSVMLQGGGAVTLVTTSGGGSAFIDQGVGGVTLTNVNNTIQGAGVIGNGGLTLVNQATINANSSAQTLLLNGSGGVTNTGLMEASGGGILQVASITVNNGGGNITANAGSSVQIFSSAHIQGGTLTNNGSFFGTPVGYVAYLDGSTGAGAVTINGTYTSDTNTETYLLGVINNHGNILLNGGGGSNAFIAPDTPNVMLQGGGTLTLVTNGGGGNAYIQQGTGGVTLENFDNTIQGAGIIGNGGLTLLNDAGGTILANAAGQTLLLNGSGSITNNGTFQVNPNAALVVQTGPFTNYASNTLTGGTYNVYGPSTLQIYQLGNTGGEIHNNAATILLDAAGSNFTDAAGLNALSNFNNNMAAGSFTIQNGRNFTSPSSFPTPAQ